MSFPVRIRTAQDLAHIRDAYHVGRQIAEIKIALTGITADLHDLIAQYASASDDASIAIGAGMSDVVNGKSVPESMSV